MSEPSPPRGYTGVSVGVAVVLAAFFAVLMVRAWLVDTQAENLCRALATIVVEGDQALDSIDYYRQPRHFDELAAAHARNDRLLDLMDCQPIATKEGS